MASEAAWQTFGATFATLGTGAVIAALQGPSNSFNEVLLYGGASITLVGLAVLMWQLICSAKEAKPLSENPSLTGSGTTVISIGQQGGVTAGIYINQAATPEFRVTDAAETPNADGTYDSIIYGRVIAQFTPGNLHVEIKAVDILYVNIMPQAIGGFSGIVLRNVLRTPRSYAADIPSPSGIYVITVKTKQKCKINLDTHF